MGGRQIKTNEDIHKRICCCKARDEGEQGFKTRLCVKGGT